jgi:D-ribose pyranase
MLRTGILNPHLNSLLSRVRHTNTLVIADRGFPFWPQIETIDLSLVDDIPTVLDVLKVPTAIGLIRTADTTQYSNVILESA